MADWGRTLDEVIDGLTLPQFRLLSKMRKRRVHDERRWNLQVASLLVQTEAQGEALEKMLDVLSDEEDGESHVADMGGGFSVSKKYPLLHELTPIMVAGNRQLKKLVKFVTVKEDA